MKRDQTKLEDDEISTALFQDAGHDLNNVLAQQIETLRPTLSYVG